MQNGYDSSANFIEQYQGLNEIIMLIKQLSQSLGENSVNAGTWHSGPPFEVIPWACVHMVALEFQRY